MSHQRSLAESLPAHKATRRTITRVARAAILVASCASCLHLPGRPDSSADFWGFTGPWDRRSDSSATMNAAHLSRIVTGWIAFDTLTLMPVQLYSDTLAATATIRGRAMALVTSYNGSRFHPGVIKGLGQSERSLSLAAAALGNLVGTGGYTGVVMDFEGMTPRDLPELLRVTRELADSARAHGATTVAIAVPAGDTAAYPGALLLGGADVIMPMLYDQHWIGSPPGPISSPEWVRRNLGARVAEVGAKRIVAALPLYGYRWRRTAAAEVIGFADAVRLTSMTNTRLIRDIPSGTLRATSPEGWEVWITDAGLLRTLMSDARLLGVTTFAFWRLGLEDPALWDGTR